MNNNIYGKIFFVFYDKTYIGNKFCLGEDKDLLMQESILYI